MSKNWETQLREDLHETEKEMVPQDLFRLAQARNKALCEKRSRRTKLLWPTLGVSLASVMLFGLVLNSSEFMDPTDNISPSNKVVSEEMLFDESLDLYEELDFYYWLSESENGVTG